MSDDIRNDQERLNRLIDDINERAMHDNLRPHEVEEIRELWPEVKETLEGRRRIKWLLKALGAMLLAIPAIGTLVGGTLKIVDWIRSH